MEERSETRIQFLLRTGAARLTPLQVIETVCAAWFDELNRCQTQGPWPMRPLEPLIVQALKDNGYLDWRTD